MKEDTTNRSWTPTLTLAKLYEEQNQFYDALAAYELISQTDHSPAVRQKIEELQLRLLGDSSLKYDSRIEQLFSPEELVYFKILSHSAFEHLSAVQQQQKTECSLQDSDLVFTEDDFIKPDDANPESELEQLLQDIEKQKKPRQAAQPAEGAELTIGDLAVELIRRFGKDNKFKELDMADLLKLILEFETHSQGGK